MPNTNEENKNARSETWWECVWNEIKPHGKALTGLVLYLYFSMVGYVYDYVYYSHYGLDILKYERPEDFIFSIFHHGGLLFIIIISTLAIFFTIVVLTILGFSLEKLRQWLQAKKEDVGGKHHRGKMIRVILQKTFAAQKFILVVVAFMVQKTFAAQKFILVVVAFMVPFCIASFLAQTDVADGSEKNAKGRLYTINPNRHLDDAVHIGSTADYMIFLKNDKNNKNNAAGVSHGSPNSKESDGSNRVHNSDNQEERVISSWAEAILTWLNDKIKYCLLNWCAQFDREKGFVLVVPTSNVASFDVEIEDRTVDKCTKDERSDKCLKDQTLDNLWIPDAENRSFPESYLFIGTDPQAKFIPYVVVDPRNYKKPGIRAPMVYSLQYIKPEVSELDHRHEEWLRQFHESARACSGENKRVRIRVRGFASNEPFKDGSGDRAGDSDEKNRKLANKRASTVKDFLESLTKNAPDESSKLDGSSFTIESDSWENPEALAKQRLVEHRIDWGTIQPNFLNRNVHIIIEDAGKCSNRGEVEP